MNALVEITHSDIVQHGGRMAVAEVVQRAKVVQEVMQAVMKENVHFGRIPGTDKPTLLKPGAEKLCMVFMIGDEYRIEDLSTSDVVRYRLTCVGKHQGTGAELGQGVGECSSSEEKYRWRKAVCKEEFEATPANMRRIKYGKKTGGGFYTQEQVRTDPADLANTVLKMASKRAKMAMVLNVTAASDCFSQDLEELDDVLREHLTEAEGAPLTPPAPITWPEEAFALQFTRWEKAVQAGIKSVDDILALARSKGPLTPAQEAQIRGIKPAEPPPAEPAAPEHADFIADMDSAEAKP